MSPIDAVWPFVCLLLNITLQIFAYKFILKRRLLRSEYFGFGCALFFLIMLELVSAAASPGEWFWRAFANLIIYLCLSFGYFTYINLGETARRIRLLRELYDAPEGLTEVQLLSRYSAAEVIDIRMVRLINNAQIIQRDGKYFVGSPVMLSISKIILMLKWLVIGKKSEFD